MPTIAGDSYGQVESLKANRDAMVAQNYFNTIAANQRAQQMAVEQQQQQQLNAFNLLRTIAEQRMQQQESQRLSQQFAAQMEAQKAAQMADVAYKNRSLGLNEKFYDWQIGKPDTAETRQKYAWAIQAGSSADIPDDALARLAGLSIEELKTVKPIIIAQKQEKIATQKGAEDYAAYLSQPDPTDATKKRLLNDARSDVQTNSKNPYFGYITQMSDGRFVARKLYNFQTGFGETQGPPIGLAPVPEPAPAPAPVNPITAIRQAQSAPIATNAPVAAVASDIPNYEPGPYGTAIAPSTSNDRVARLLALRRNQIAAIQQEARPANIEAYLDAYAQSLNPYSLFGLIRDNQVPTTRTFAESRRPVTSMPILSAMAVSPMPQSAITNAPPERLPATTNAPAARVTMTPAAREAAYRVKYSQLLAAYPNLSRIELSRLALQQVDAEAR